MREYGERQDRGTNPFIWAAGIGAVLGIGSIIARKSFAPAAAARIARDAQVLLTDLRQAGRLTTSVETEINRIASAPPTWKETLQEALNSPTARKLHFWSQHFYPTTLLEQLTGVREFMDVAAQPKFTQLGVNLRQGKTLDAITGGINPSRLAYARGKLIDLRAGTTLGTPNVYLYKVGEPAGPGEPPRGFLARNVHRMTSDVSPIAGTFWDKTKQILDVGQRGRRMGEEPLWRMGWTKNPVAALFKGLFVGTETVATSVPGGIGVMQEATLGNFFSSLLGGRGKPGQISTTTMLPFHMLERMNEALAKSGFSAVSLSERSMGSGLDLFASVALKRFLPIAAGGFYLGYLNQKVEDLTGDSAYGRLGSLYERINLDVAGLKDKAGFTSWAKRWSKVLPGAEHLVHPFVEQPMGLSREELEEYYKTGEEPVRKGRWWGFLSTSAYKGGRIQYYTPPFVKRAHRPMRETDFWGSTDEYFANSVFPTPEHPLSTVKHFLTDPYALEKRTYWSHPTPVSGPLFEEYTPFGAVLNATLGTLLKPQRYMHVSEMPYLPGGRNPAYRYGIEEINERTKALAEQKRAEEAESTQYFGYITPSGSITPTVAMAQPGYGGADGGGVGGGTVGSTSGGGGGSGGYGSSAVREGIRAQNVGTRSVDRYKRRVGGRVTSTFVLSPARLRNEPGEALSPEQLEDLTTPQSVGQQLSRGYYLGTEMGGIYGWALSSATGYPASTSPALQHIGRLSSFEHYFWDVLGMGGVGGELSEISRRFFPHRYRLQPEYNPLINRTMPSWLPGAGAEEPGYFLDFHTGVPQLKIPAGEYRLPGKLYEQVHGFDPMGLKIRGSMLGKSVESMIQYYIGQSEPPDEDAEELMAWGTRIHAKVEADLMAKGAVSGTEVSIYNPEYNITGTMDVLANQGGEAVPVEIKTVGINKFETIDKPYRYHMEQLNFYIKTLGAKKGYMYYVPREDPSQYKVFKVNYDPGLMESTMNKVEEARRTVREMVGRGEISRGELYPVLERFRVLADVAPWSETYKRYRDFLSSDDQLSPEEKEEYIRIKKRTTARKKRYDISPYRFLYSDIEKQGVTVKSVIDPNTFTVEEKPGTFRLAGVHVKSSGEEPQGKEFIGRSIYPGARVTIGYSADDLNRQAQDLLKTTRVAVWSGGVNLNRELIDRGIGREKEEWTPAGVHARFTPFEIAMGTIGERFFHAPIPWFHQKWWPEDSAIEAYKRYRVYGQEFQAWSPKTLAQGVMGLAGHGPLWAAASLAGIGWALGRTTAGSNVAELAVRTGMTEPTWFKGIGRGKGLGAVAGATIGLGAWAYQQFAKRKDEAYIPSERMKERGIEEYYDVLKYVKYRGLYERTLGEIQKREGFDLGGLVQELEERGGNRQKRTEELVSEKRGLVKAGREKHSERIAAINDELSRLGNYRRTMELTPLDVQALMYRQEFRTTMYGADPYGDWRNIIAAVPNKDREFLNYFAEAPFQERKEILKYTPSYISRFLKAKWGGEAEELPPLDEYFKSHWLPPADWKGWSPEANLEDYKAKAMIQAGLDLKEQGIWPAEESKIQEEGIPYIPMGKPTPGAIRSRLNNVLRGAGLEDVMIDVYTIPTATTTAYRVNIDVEADRGRDVRNYIRDNPKVAAGM